MQLENPATVAAVVVEPFTGAAGGFPLPDGYLPRLRALCDFLSESLHFRL